MEFALEQENVVELSEEAVEVALENISIAIEDIQDLLKFKEVTLATEDINDTTRLFLKDTLESFYTRYNFDLPATIATESFNQDTKTIALEGFKDIILRIWEAIQNTFKAIWNYITGIFNNAKAKTDRVSDQVNKVNAKCDKIEKAPKGVDPNTHKQNINNPPRIFITDLDIMKIFGHQEGELKVSDFTNKLKDLAPLAVSIRGVLGALVDDCKDLEKYGKDVNGSLNQRQVDSKPLTGTIANSTKLLSNHIIDTMFAKADKVPEEVLTRLNVHASDTKMNRQALGLADGVVIYFVKPLETFSFYKAAFNTELPERPKYKIYLYTIEEIQLVTKACQFVIDELNENSDKFKKDAEHLIWTQKVQGETLDKCIKGALEDVNNYGFDGPTTKLVLEPLIELHKQTGLLSKQLIHIHNKVIGSASRYMTAAEHLANELAKAVRPEEKEEKK